MRCHVRQDNGLIGILVTQRDQRRRAAGNTVRAMAEHRGKPQFSKVAHGVLIGAVGGAGAEVGANRIVGIERTVGGKQIFSSTIVVD